MTFTPFQLSDLASLTESERVTLLVHYLNHHQKVFHFDPRTSRASLRSPSEEGGVEFFAATENLAVASLLCFFALSRPLPSPGVEGSSPPPQVLSLPRESFEVPEDLTPGAFLPPPFTE